MFSSMQTTNPSAAWVLIQPELLKIAAVGKIPGHTLQNLLGIYCRGAKAAKDTVHWMLNEGMLIAHHEEIPTSYTLTEKGRASSPASN